jgi:NIMA (never in mitosis gene a)-related kinase 2
MRKNLQGRTLVELAQGKSGVPSSASAGRVGSAANSESEDAVDAAMKARMEFDDEPAHWDPERDEMPSPFLARGVKTAGRGLIPIR